MGLYKSLTLTFAMYSKIPMPMVEWDEKSMQWVFSCFPLVGVVIGLTLYLWLKIAIFLSISPLLAMVIGMLLPIALSGGIHLDGLCDTSDALGSHQSRERKLEIMKDPHIGAFGVIGLALYLILLAGCWCSILLKEENIFSLCIIPVLSRGWVSLAAVTRNNARKSGLLATFTDAAAGKRNLIAAVLWLVLTCSVLCLQGWTDRGMVLASLLMAVYFYNMTEKEFGGITGDLCGWYLQMQELVFVLVIALFGGR